MPKPSSPPTSRRSRWTKRRLWGSLRRLISSDRVHIVISKLDPSDCSAEAYWREDDGELYLTVDHDQEGRVTCVIHEMLHYILAAELNAHFSSEVEEYMIQGLEHACFNWIRADKRRFEWWRRAVNRKIDDEES